MDDLKINVLFFPSKNAVPPPKVEVELQIYEKSKNKNLLSPIKLSTPPFE